MGPHFQWDLTSDGTSLPVGPHFRWDLTSGETSLPMGPHFRWDLTSGRTSLPVGPHFRWALWITPREGPHFSPVLYVRQVGIMTGFKVHDCCKTSWGWIHKVFRLWLFRDSCSFGTCLVAFCSCVAHGPVSLLPSGITDHANQNARRFQLSTKTRAVRSHRRLQSQNTRGEIPPRFTAKWYSALIKASPLLLGGPALQVAAADTEMAPRSSRNSAILTQILDRESSCFTAETFSSQLADVYSTCLLCEAVQAHWLEPLYPRRTTQPRSAVR